MGKKSRLTPEQRTQLVMRVLAKEEPAAQIARRAGISEQSLYRWRDEFLKAGQQAMNGRAGANESSEEIDRLNRRTEASPRKSTNTNGETIR